MVLLDDRHHIKREFVGDVNVDDSKSNAYMLKRPKLEAPQVAMLLPMVLPLSDVNVFGTGLAVIVIEQRRKLAVITFEFLELDQYFADNLRMEGAKALKILDRVLVNLKSMHDTLKGIDPQCRELVHRLKSCAAGGTG